MIGGNYRKFGFKYSSLKVELIDPVKEVKPFLRWAGGKTWLVKSLKKNFPGKFTFNNYHEPFLGGASLFLFIKPQKRSFLSDLNPELIETYEVVRDNVEKLIVELSKYKNSEKNYYSIREQVSKSKIINAARFIYLNQTSFNGIYRVNLEGKYNVPYGFRTKEFLDADNLRLVSKRLKKTTLMNADFAQATEWIKEGDFVFLDPPYTVSHNNNGFIKYNQKLFSIEDQYRLAEYIRLIKKKRAYYILTNAAHEKIDEIFGGINDKTEMRRASLIGGLSAERGSVSEYLFSNIPNLKLHGK